MADHDVVVAPSGNTSSFANDNEATTTTETIIATHHSRYFTHPTSSQTQILKRKCLIAPITAVSVVPKCNRVVVARGSEIESCPLYVVSREDANDVDDAESTNADGEGSGCNDAKDTRKSTFRKDRGRTYRHRAFAAWDDSGIIHGIRYAKSFQRRRCSRHEVKSATASGAMSDAPTDSRFAHWSSMMAVFGGRKLALVSGGGIGYGCGHENVAEDPFVPLYFAKTPRKTNDSTSRDDISSCLTLPDLIYDLRLLVFEDNHSKSRRILCATGMAQNVVELWSFDLLSPPASTNGSSIPSQKMVLLPNRMRKIVCEVRCITYSLSFYGWGGGKYYVSSDSDNDNIVTDLDLAVAVGTPSSFIYVWNALSKEEGNDIAVNYSERCCNGNDTARQKQLSIVTKPTSHKLFGHDGVVFSCRYGYNGLYLASTGDDRTVRLWKRSNDYGNADSLLVGNNINSSSPFETAEDARLITDERYTYQLIWTTYGHTARVWDCAFASPQSSMVVSCGEDSTVRLWNMRDEGGRGGGRQMAILKGFNCLNAWCVDVDADEDVAIAGGNDGTAKIWSLKDQVVLNADRGDKSALLSAGDSEAAGMCSYLLPKELKSDDAPSIEATSEENGQTNDDVEEEVVSEGPEQPAKKKKKKKRKPKAKNSAQAVVGMVFHDLASGKLLVVARSGTIHSLDLETGEWKSRIEWCKSQGCGTNSGVDPSTGSCIATHPSDKFLAIGTTKGDVAIVPTNEKRTGRIYFSTRPHYAIQGLEWFDSRSLVTLHIKGVVVWWEFPQDNPSAHSFPSSPPILRAVLAMGTVGVPMAIAFDELNRRLAVGDSRGNIALFDIAGTGSTEEQPPIELVRKVHEKEHVNDIMFSTDRSKVVSAGNDGCIAECIITSLPSGKVSMRKAMSVSVPALTGVTRVWRAHSSCNNSSLIAGGYFGNSFVLWDVTRGYQMMNIDTGGRQRRSIIEASFDNSSFCHRMSICVGRKDGETELLVHSLGQFRSSRPKISFRYGLGLSYHGEFINSVCWIETDEPDTSLLLSGSNDSTVKLSCFRQDALTASKELPTHVSCVRGVCASRHPGSAFALLSTCGAKLSASFYLLEDSSFSTKSPSEFDPKVSFLCSNRLSKDVSMDHRMNAVKAIPLLSSSTDGSAEKSPHHLVLAGDSDGGLHLFVVGESLEQPRNTVAHMLSTDSRPILCIDIIRVSQHCVFACVGDTSGQVSIWRLPGAIEAVDGDVLDRNDGAEKRLCGPLPESPIHIYDAHQCGTNCISATLMIRSLEKDDEKQILAICSGGDDEAISLWSGTIDATDTNGACSPLSNHHLIRTSQASSSALKGIKIVGSESSGYGVYTAGYDQRVALWEVTLISSGLPRDLAYLSSAPVDVSDINCLDARSTQRSGCPSPDEIVVGGEGAELFSVDPNIRRAAVALSTASYLLITCGAGMSADSGLATYENMPEEYRVLCDPSKLVQETERFQSFWLRFSRSYADVKPHSGYKILDRWCREGKLRNFATDQEDGPPCWVYSSNVDGHFRRFESFRDHICEIHGLALDWRCADKLGQSQGSDRKGEHWNEWNKNRSTCDDCSSTTFRIETHGSTTDGDAGGTIVCKHCNRPARPNVLMFHDTDENVLNDISLQRDRYQAWEARIEDEVVNNGRNLVILEIGCGKNVPAIRDESEEVLEDCLSGLSQTESGGNVTLIRINPKDAEPALNSGSEHTISIYGKAEKTLNEIDSLLY